jgi:hypothetical protein
VPGHPGFPKAKIVNPSKRPTLGCHPKDTNPTNVFPNHRECVEGRALSRADQCKSRRYAIDCGRVRSASACSNEVHEVLPTCLTRGLTLMWPTGVPIAVDALAGGLLVTKTVDGNAVNALAGQDRRRQSCWCPGYSPTRSQGSQRQNWCRPCRCQEHRRQR